MKEIHTSESDEQIVVFNWAQMMEGRYPELALLHHIPNGGKRSMSEAVRFKREGVKAGVPDICLPVPRGKYHGLYVEMKAADGRVSEYQKEWLSKLTAQGYFTAVCFGAQSAIDTITRYLSLEVQVE